LGTREDVIRRIGFWAAVLTGVVLVGSQFSCSRPETTLSAPGFRHASRRVASPVKPAAARDIPPSGRVPANRKAATDA